MGTQVAAGAAALIRQYLREGFYPSGERNPKDSISNPSSSLIKAILLNGGQDMLGVDNGKVTVKAYDNNQNFGRISLMDSVYIKYKSNVHMKFWDRIVLHGDNADSYFINIDMSAGCDTNTFTATLVWTDIPGVPGCASCLINDLDLFVLKKSFTFFSNGLDEKDDRNNVERIRIHDIQDGDELIIYVEASASMSDQSYALVATGCFAGGTTRITSKSSTTTSDTNVFSANYNKEEDQQKTSDLSIIISVSVLLLICLCVGIMYYYKRNKNEKNLNAVDVVANYLVDDHGGGSLRQMSRESSKRSANSSSVSRYDTYY